MENYRPNSDENHKKIKIIERTIDRSYTTEGKLDKLNKFLTSDTENCDTFFITLR